MSSYIASKCVVFYELYCTGPRGTSGGWPLHTCPTLTVSRHSVIQTLHQWRCDILLPRAAINLQIIHYHFWPRRTSRGWPLHTYSTLTLSRHSVIQTLHQWRCDILLPKAAINLQISHYHFWPRRTSRGWSLHTYSTLTLSRHSVIQTLHQWRCYILLPRAADNLRIIHYHFRRSLGKYVSTTIYKMLFVFRNNESSVLEWWEQVGKILLYRNKKTKQLDFPW